MDEDKIKILVLSCGTGGGHNSAAKAIVEAFKERNIQCDFKEYLEIINPKVKNCVNRLYIRSTVGRGNIFKVAYHLGELYQKTKIKSPVYGLNSLSHRKLYKFIKENGYQYIITTHLFAAQALTTIKKKHQIHFIAVATDYVSIPFWEETNPDYYIIPSDDLKDSFYEKGIKEEKVIPLGIPVSLSIQNKVTREEIANKFNLDLNKSYILITTGSMGFGKNEKLIEKLLEEKKDNEVIIFACGTNKKMEDELKQKFQSNEDLIVLPYTNELISYMKLADVILTKPGGLTTTEVASLRKPFIHTIPIPGCENYNAEYFSKKGMSLKSNSIEEVCENVRKLMQDKELQEELVKNQIKYIDPNASKKIADFVCEQIKELYNK